MTRPQAVKDKGGKPKWHNLIRPWLRHLAACASGLALTTFQVGAANDSLTMYVPDNPIRPIPENPEDWTINAPVDTDGGDTPLVVKQLP